MLLKGIIHILLCLGGLHHTTAEGKCECTCESVNAHARARVQVTSIEKKEVWQICNVDIVKRLTKLGFGQSTLSERW